METANPNITTSLMGIHRHRLNLDGRGITTLVGLHGCPLHCRYCLNNRCHSADGLWRKMSVQELYERVKCDDLYFRATGGGITFGGGEPALHSEFIDAFVSCAGHEWTYTMETSLNVPQEDIARLVDVVDDFIIDIKTLDETTYKLYTGGELEQVVENLNYLIEHEKSAHMTVRVPLIPGYNSEEDVKQTLEKLQDCAIGKVHSFNYVTTPLSKSSVATTAGKTKCEILKKVRSIIAQANHVAYTPTPCTHTVCSSGHCPVCEKELRMLTEELSQRDEIII